MTAIAGPLSVAVHSSAYTKDSKDQIISNYLGQEAIEILRYKRDSIFLACTNTTSGLCTAQEVPNPGSGVYERPWETAWRLFKTQMSGSGSCMDADGCRFDFYNIVQAPTTVPNLYTPGDNNCDILYRDDTKLIGSSPGNATDGMYLCTINKNANFRITRFTRTVKIISVPSIAGNTYDTNYNDDLRIEASVTYPQKNGFLKTVKVVDFMRPRV